MQAQMKDLCSSQVAAEYQHESKITLITCQQTINFISLLDELSSSVLPIWTSLTAVGACTPCSFLQYRHIGVSNLQLKSLTNMRDSSASELLMEY